MKYLNFLCSLVFSLFALSFSASAQNVYSSFSYGDTGFEINYTNATETTSCLNAFPNSNGGAAFLDGNVASFSYTQNESFNLVSPNVLMYGLAPFYAGIYFVKGEGPTAVCTSLNSQLYQPTGEYFHIDMSSPHNAKVIIYAKANTTATLEFHLGYAEGNGYPSISTHADGIAKTISLSTEMAAYEIDFSDWMNRDKVNMYGIILSDPNVTVNIESIQIGSAARSYNIIKGTVFGDDNNDCLNSSENGISGIVMSATDGVNTYHGRTDVNGNYKILVDTGSITYHISPLLNGRTKDLFSFICLASANVVVNGARNEFCCTDFAASKKNCASLSIEINSDRRRRCFRNNTWVVYSNTGYAPSDAGVVKIVYPKYVVPISSSPSWDDQIGDTLIYYVNGLAPQANGFIAIVDSVVCGIEEIRGWTQCTKAFISPRSSCSLVSPSWDGSSITVQSSCQDSLVYFEISNIGHAMTGSSEYRLYTNDTLIYISTFQLAEGDHIDISYPSINSNLRLEADQRPFYPYPSRPRAFAQGCDAPIDESHVIFAPQDDLEESVAVSCLEIRDSYDPNEKVASPIGYTEDHLIKAGQRIQYTVRFQNTGSDVAYKVKVVDTLDSALDVNSFIEASSSHPYTLNITNSIEGKTILIYTFNNINLADSTSDEPASHGFFSFYISAAEDLTDGTHIYNKADIFFDYNSAIVTNVVNHTIGTYTVTDLSKGDKVEVTTGLFDRQDVNNQRVTVYPNPVSDIVQVKIDQQFHNGQLSISDLSGHEVWSATLKSDVTSVPLFGLPAGMYLYKVQTNGELIGVGQLLVK